MGGKNVESVGAGFKPASNIAIRPDIEGVDRGRPFLRILTDVPDHYISITIPSSEAMEFLKVFPASVAAAFLSSKVR